MLKKAVQCLDAATNTSILDSKHVDALNDVNHVPTTETARNLNQFNNNDQSMKLLNFNINQYLANLNRLNGQQPTNDQLMNSLASLINANTILSNNPSLANYQTLSGIINNHSLPSNNNVNNLNKKLNLPISLPSSSNLPLSNHQPINHQPISSLPSAPMISNLPNIVSNNVPIHPITSNQPNIGLNSELINGQNRNTINILNNANKAFDLSVDDQLNGTLNGNQLNGNELNANYFPFNGENSMPEHWRLLITGMKKFSLNLIKSLHNFEPRDSSMGIILSPLSIWSTLVVSYMGAKSESSDEIADVLNLRNVPKETVLLAYRGLKEFYDLRCRNMNLTKSNDELSLSNQKINFCSLANRVFVNSNLKLNKFVKDNFEQEIKSMDFVHEAEKSRKSINQWIEQKTNHKIKDLIEPGAINSFTNIVIANAIYFQAKWFTQFDASKTVKGKFQV